MRHRLIIADAAHDVWLSRSGGEERLLVGETWHDLAPAPAGAVAVTEGDLVHVHCNGRAHTVRYHDVIDHYAEGAATSQTNSAAAPMPGAVVSLNVSPGDTVAEGQVMMVIESMKMETVIRATRDGVVEAVHYAVGASFDRDAMLVTLAPLKD
jgi:acetyl/propionyl-CoA carboxylase alpha subunit